MANSINTNITSLQVLESLRTTSDMQAKTLNRVTSGLRIVQSGDDAAGLAIANSLRSDQAVLSQGVRNANDGLSTLQTVDGGMGNISSLLDRARTLATQSASDAFDGDRTLLNKEFQSVVKEIDRVSQAIGMNTGGKFAKSLAVFVGGGRDATGGTATAGAVSNGSVSIDLSHSAVDSKSLGLTTYKASQSSADFAVSLTQAAGAGGVDFKIFGAGFEAGVTVNAKTATATSIDGVVNSINAAIADAGNVSGSDTAALKSASIVATKSADGKHIDFSSANSSFSITEATNGTAAAENILGTTATQALVASGGQSTTLGYAAFAASDKQSLTISMVDSTGSLISTQVNLDQATDTTKALVMGKINDALKATNNDLAKLVAVDPDSGGTGIQLMGNSGKFTVFAATATTANKGVLIGGAQNTFVDSSAGAAGAVNISDAGNAQLAVNALATAVSNLGAAQAVVGKGQNQLTYAVNLGQSQLGNMAAAESRIRDADLAREATNMTKAQMLMQAGIAALAQANSAPQQILTLLRG